mmetsp:Transcript_8737/g.16486  ORF Transcript_8737/g.16486 Transcript_8737/m.16486 type:complete len:220 (+) Transcript_8737:1903-2562(+)
MCPNIRMFLPTLEFFVRVDVWVFIVQTNHKSSVYKIWFLMVKKRSSKSLVIPRFLKRISKRVLNKSRLDLLRRYLPNFFNTQSIRLLTPSSPQPKYFHQLFRTTSPCSFCKYSLSRMQFDSTFKGILRLTTFVNAHISRSNSLDCRLFYIVQNLTGCKTRINFNSHFFCFCTQISTQLSKTNDIVPIIVQLFRKYHVWNSIAFILCEKKEFITRYRCGM